MAEQIKLSAQLRLEIASRVVQMINEQIEQGKDIDGKAYAYGTKTFVRPVGGSRIKNITQLAKDGKLQMFTTKSGAKWMAVIGGYKAFREMRGLPNDDGFLQDTGQMLRSMKASTNADEALVTFTDPNAAKRAFWFNVSGAGKSRKLWKFLGLTKENQDKLAEEYTAKIIAEIIDRI